MGTPLGSEDSEPCCLNSTRTFIDESFYLVKPGVGRYLFAAVSVDASNEGVVREKLRRALPGRLPRFHWRVDSDITRRKAAKALADAPCDGLIMFQVDVPQRKQERFRQHALWNLVAELRGRCCHTLMLEARESKQNTKDQKTMASIEKSEMAGPLFTYTFGRPLDEPLLWMPDILLGVYGAKHRYSDDKYWHLLQQHPDIFEIPPPRV